MKSYVCSLALIGFGLHFIYATGYLFGTGAEVSLNDRPIIGILAQETSGKERNYGTSYISASYVKFLEAAGARIVPIMINQPHAYYKELFSALNGVLFPGGSASLETSGFGKAGKIIYDLAIEANEKGDYFPLWGTCLGFELLNFLAAGSKDYMMACSAEDLALPLKLMNGYTKSRLLGASPRSVLSILKSEPVTANYHQWCLTEYNYSKSGLDDFFHILSQNEDRNNVTFISTIEAFGYPIYATAWHPEMNQFEFVIKTGQKNIPHFPEAIFISQYFANFFVHETRRSGHKFPTEKKEKQSLIYNYNPIYTGLHGSDTEQRYFFNESTIYQL